MTGAPVRADKVAPPEPREREETRRVHDEDEALALALVAQVIGALGCGSVRPVPVDLGETAARTVRARGARGLMSEGRILLDRGRVDLGGPSGRYLLAHEATHAVQRVEVQQRPDVRRPSRAEAELEADRVGRAFALGRPPGRTHAVLPVGATAADTGVLDIVSVPGARDDIVARLHNGLWISDGDVDQVLRRLEALPPDEASAVVRALTVDDRQRLLDNLGTGHVRKFRRGFTAVLAGLPDDERARVDTDTLLALDLHGISTREYDQLIEMVRSLPEERVRALVGHKTLGAPWRRLLAVPPRDLDLIEQPPKQETEEEKKQRQQAEEARARAEEALARDPMVVAALDQLRALPRELTTAQALQALQLLRGLTADARTPDAGATPPLGEDRLRYVVGRLDAEGAVDRILVAADENAVGNAHLEPVVRLVVRHAPNAASRRVEQVLYSLISDWFVTKAAAIRAFGIMLELAGAHPARIPPLDARGFVDRMFDNLPEEFLYREDVREETRTIMAARNPETLFAKACSLLTTRVFSFDWAVTARDAFLAFQMVRALSGPRRQAFQDLDGGSYWNSMITEMTPSMRAATDLGTTRRPDESRERSGIRLQLSDDALWSEPHAADVRVLVAIAVSLGEHRWVFERSRQVAAYKVAALRPTVDRFALFDPEQGRNDYRPMPVEGTRWYQEGPLAGLVALGRGVALLASGRLYLSGANQLDVGTGLEVTRGLSWVRMIPAAAQAEATPATGDQANGENLADVTFSQDPPHVDVRIKTLRLSAYHFLAAGKSIRAGATVLRDVDLHADLDTQGWRDVHSRITFSEVNLQDVLYSTGSSTIGLAQLRMGRVGVTSSAAPEQVAGGPVRGLDIGLVDTLLAGLTTRMDLRIGSIRMDGLYLDGQRVTRVELDDLRVSTQANQTAYLKELQDAYRRQLQATRDPRQRSRYQRRLIDIADRLDDQARLIELRRPDRSPLSNAESDELTHLINKVANQRDSGAVVTLGAARVRGVSGAVDIASLDLKNIVGGGELSRPLFDLISDPALVRRFLRSGVPAATGPAADELQLDLGDVELADVSYVGDLPTATSLTNERDAAADKTPERAELERLIPFARTYERLSVRLDTEAAPLGPDDRHQLLFARQELVRHARIHVEHLALRETTVTGSGGGRLGLSVRELEAQHLSAGAVQVDSVTGRGVTVGASTIPGAPGLGGLVTGELKADELKVGGVRVAGRRVAAAIELKAVDIAVENVPEGWRIRRLSLGSLTLRRLDLEIGEKRVHSREPVVVTEIAGDVTLETAPGSNTNVDRVRVDRLSIGRITATTLHYVDGDRTLDVTARLRSLVVTGLYWDVAASRATRVPGSEQDPPHGRVRLGAIDQFAISGRVAAGLEGALTARSKPSGAALEVRLDEHGVRTVLVNLADLDFPRAEWTGDNGVFVIAERPVSLRGLIAEVHPVSGPKGLTGLDVTRLTVEEMRAEHLAYTDDEGTVQFTPPPGAGSAFVTLRGIDVRDLQWRESPSLQLDAASVDVSEATYLTKTLQLRGGTLHGRQLHVAKSPDGTLGVSATELSGAADVSTAGDRGRVTIDHAVLDMQYRDGELRIGGEGRPGLWVGKVQLDRFVMSTSRFDVAGAGPVSVEGIAVQGLARAGRVKTDQGDKDKPDWSTFRVGVGLVDIDTIRMRSVRVTVPRPSGPVQVDLPPGRESTITNLRLRPRLGETAFVVDTRGANTVVSGLVDVQRLVVPRLVARMGTTLRLETGLQADDVKAGIAASGETEIDLARLFLQDLDVRSVLTPAAPKSWTPAIDLRVIRQQIRDTIRGIRPLFQHLQGGVDLTLVAPIVGTVPIHLPLVDGSIDPFALEGKLPWWLDELLDFKLVGRELVLYVDPPPAPGIVDPPPIPILSWNLTAGEFTRLSTDRLIEIDRLIDFAITRAGMPLLSPIPFTGGTASSGPGRVRVRDIDAQLRVTNPSTLPLDIVLPPVPGSAPAAAGIKSLHVDLAPNALLGLRTRGAVGAGAGSLLTEVISFNLEGLQCSYADPTTGLRVEVSTAAIGLGGGRAEVGFRDFDPTGVAATARTVEARKLHVKVQP